MHKRKLFSEKHIMHDGLAQATVTKAAGASITSVRSIILEEYGEKISEIHQGAMEQF
jgi:hypothetical protein